MTVDQTATWRHYSREYDYPNTAQLWPTSDPDPTPSIGLGADRLAEIAKIAGKGTSVRFDFFGALKPAKFTVIGANITGIVMPYRLS